MKDITTAYHTCCTPDISRRAVRWTNEYFQTTVLAGLNVVRKMMMLNTQKTASNAWPDSNWYVLYLTISRHPAV